MPSQLLNRIFITCFCLLLIFNNLPAQSNEDCLTCHEDIELTTIRHGKTKSLYVNNKRLDKSVHEGVKCASCHTDAAVDEFPHAEFLKPVNCGSCHFKSQRNFNAGIHGQALKLNILHAPDCKDCHGHSHNILSHDLTESMTYKMNIPFLCGKCHREDASVASTYNLTEHNILENYSQNIHGKGFFKSGLIATATCNDCHGNHLVLPHTSPNSTISIKNIAKTCMKCHTRIEEIHKKIIRIDLWKKKPGAIPACTDCHPPHKEDVNNISATISDLACLRCHEKDDIHKLVNDEKVSLQVIRSDLTNSVHRKIPCIKCHTGVSTNAVRPCVTIQHVDCSNCHAEVANLYSASGHGMAYSRKEKNAPYCSDCHGTHKVKSRYDDTSPTYRSAIPGLCGECHRENGKAVEIAELKEINAFRDYSSSVHGRGLTEKGLLLSAICTDCHTTHYMLKESDERSSIHPNNVPATCASCHKGIYNEYIRSDHAITMDDGKRKYPTCVDCHSAHVISEIDQDKFMNEVTLQCGSCHKDLAETYLDTYHGKAYHLGYLKAAKCSDCHGAHNILKAGNPNSSIGTQNIVSTCQKCHPDANINFTGYLTHATHHDRSKYPILYYTFWGMTSLLIGVFGFFGLHLILWFPRSIREARKKRQHLKTFSDKYYIRRFSRSQRITHIFVILSFLLLALTGMMLKFSNMDWANFMSRAIGGVHVAGTIHRFAAIITFGYFIYHLISLIRMKIKRHTGTMEFLFGKQSLMFNLQDIKDFWATIKWFIGRGPHPSYGRWTYWEKFDYMAVFWGVALIGLSGLILWFPEFFTKFCPGWIINVAMIIHSDEALLAVGFIFTIHFFNTHLRPEAFPMDTVMFTGLVPFEEFKKDRSREYDELKKSGKLSKIIVKKEFPEKWELIAKIFGYIFLAVGLTLVAMIIYSMLFGYK